MDLEQVLRCILFLAVLRRSGARREKLRLGIGQVANWVTNKSFNFCDVSQLSVEMRDDINDAFVFGQWHDTGSVAPVKNPFDRTVFLAEN